MLDLFGPINAVLILAMLPGLVQFFKELFDWQGKKVTALAMVIGVVLGVVLQISDLFPVMTPWFTILVYGLLFGMTASGYYKLVSRNDPPAQ